MGIALKELQSFSLEVACFLQADRKRGVVYMKDYEILTVILYIIELILLIGFYTDRKNDCALQSK